MGQVRAANRVEVGSTEVENPYFKPGYDEDKGNPKRIAVSINLKESAVVSLAVRGKLEPHQVAAANRFGHSWEMVNGARTKPLGERITNRGPSTLTLKLICAGDDLRQARYTLGSRCYWLVCTVCGEGKGLSDLYPDPTQKRERLTAADNLRASLDDLAAMWGLAGNTG